MKILIHDYGGYAFPIGLSRELARRGHEVTHSYATDLLTPQGTLDRREDDPAGLSFLPVQMSSDYRKDKYNFIRRRAHEVAYGKRLAMTVNELRPDLILSGNTPTEPQWALVKSAARHDIPVITWLQDVYSVAVEKLAKRKMRLLGMIAGAWYRRLDARCLRRSAGIVAITDGFLSVLAEFGVSADKVTVIPNWASLEDIPQKPRRNVWSARQGLDDALVFLYSGTLALKHNPNLLRQLAIRFKDDARVRVVVISEGPGADLLIRAKQGEGLDNLIVLPFQAAGDMPDVLASADVCVAVLEPEAGVFSVPSKVLAYHAAGRPVLAAIPEKNLAARIILEQHSGFCTGPGEVDGFLASAEKMRRDDALRTSMAASARAYALREFQIVQITDRFEECFRQVVKKSRA